LPSDAIIYRILFTVKRLSLQVHELITSRDDAALLKEGMQTKSFHKPNTKTFVATRFLAALLLFFIVDIAIKLEFHSDPFNIPERSFIWWAVKDYRDLSKAPDIMMFGSSLILAAVNEGDATHYRKLVDTATHHYSTYLSELLKRRHNYDISNFCFAIGGQMASDVYAIANNFVSKGYKPRVIVWGIAPRDLIDSAFPGATTSDTARYMNKIAGKDIVEEDRKTLNSTIDQFLRKYLFLYRVRDNFLSDLKYAMRQLQVKQAQWIASLKTPNAENATPPPGRQKMLRELMNPRDGTMGDIEVGEWLIGANAEPSKILKDNTAEYLVRYNPFKSKTFVAQRSYFEKFLQQQKECGVKVLLVNMPLTGVNMSLLPAATYDTYLYTVKSLAKRYNAEILDLNGDPRFKQSDFFDTAHLNGLGSEKFIEVLSTDSRLAVPTKQK
jgi:hypothetical protein